LIGLGAYSVRSRHILEVLHLAGISWPDRLKNIPSWVVDWTMTARPITIVYSDANLDEDHQAATHLKADIHLDPHSNILMLHGQIFDSLSQLTDPVMEYPKDGNISFAPIIRLKEWEESALKMAETSKLKPHPLGGRKTTAYRGGFLENTRWRQKSN